MSEPWTSDEFNEAKRLQGEGLTYAGIAARLNRTPKAVATKLKRGDGPVKRDHWTDYSSSHYTGAPIAKTAEDIRLTTSAELGTAALGLAYAEFFKRHRITPEQAWRDGNTKSVGRVSLYQAERKWA